MILRPRYPMMFLLALVTAFLLWYAIAGPRRERISERQLMVPLTLVNIPRNLVITSDVREAVAVRLRGAVSRAFESAVQPEVVLDLRGAQSGVHTFPIEEPDIRLPPDVSVVSVDPPEITLTLEQLETRTLPVRPVIQGTPAPGFVLGEVRVVPNTLTVQGPGSLLSALEVVESTAVSVEGATTTVETAVQPRLPHPLLRPLTSVPLLVVAEIMPAPPQPTPTPKPASRRRP